MSASYVQCVQKSRSLSVLVEGAASSQATLCKTNYVSSNSNGKDFLEFNFFGQTLNSLSHRSVIFQNIS